MSAAIPISSPGSTRAEELSLCYDPTSDLIGETDEGEPLFDGDKPSETLNEILKFCEDFEIAAQRTQAFVKELEAMDLLIDGEVTIQPEGAAAALPLPRLPHGRRGEVPRPERRELRKINQNGILPLIIAHLFSLPLMREVFGRQMQQGKVPAAEPPGQA